MRKLTSWGANVLAQTLLWPGVSDLIIPIQYLILTVAQDDAFVH